MPFVPPNRDLRVTDSMRPLLSAPLGPVVSGADAVRLCGGRVFSTIGDVVTADFLAAGMRPKLAAVDGVTRRQQSAVTVEGGMFSRTVRLRNPSGTISKDAWTVLTAAYGTEGSTLVLVDGEEDLLSIPAIILSPDDSLVLFGVPGRGVGVNEASPENKLKCKEILASMEEC